jgi:hypothetical protein
MGKGFSSVRHYSLLEGDEKCTAKKTPGDSRGHSYETISVGRSAGRASAVRSDRAVAVAGPASANHRPAEPQAMRLRRETAQSISSELAVARNLTSSLHELFVTHPCEAIYSAAVNCDCAVMRAKKAIGDVFPCAHYLHASLPSGR